MSKNTSYLELIELLLAILKSYEIDGLFDDFGQDGVLAILKPYFKYASGKLEIHNSGINTNRDDELMEFSSTLSDGSQLIFAQYMLIGYLSKDTNDILQMRLHLQDGDFKTYAEKNNLSAKMNALTMLKEEVGWDVKKTGYNTKNVWG